MLTWFMQYKKDTNYSKVKIQLILLGNRKIVGYTWASISSFRTNSTASCRHAKGDGRESHDNGEDGGDFHCLG